MPPICEICDEPFDPTDDAGLVEFSLRPSDEAWIEEMTRKDMVGHPPYCRWFCSLHYAQAVQLAHLKVDEALLKLSQRGK